MSKILEIACFNLESAYLAEKAGADRIELCADYKAGGLTPSQQIITAVGSTVKIPTKVIIRPRGGSFLYNKREVEEIKKSVLFCKEANVTGLVFGCLTPENEIDISLSKQIIDLAKDIPVTFHRAIDSCNDIETSLKILIELGFKSVLTSGGKSNAIDGVETIKALQSRFGHQINIIVGGGIRSNNISSMVSGTGCSEFHSSAITNHPEVCDAVEIQKLLSCLRIGREQKI